MFKLYYLNPKLPFLSFAIVAFLGCIAAYCLKFDTINRSLDLNEESAETNQGSIELKQ